MRCEHRQGYLIYDGRYQLCTECRLLLALGPANDAIPEDEMVLAKLLQTAGARGFVSCRGEYFADAAGETAHLAQAVACCVLGANDLDPERPAFGSGFAEGNDAFDGRGRNCDRPGFTIGAAFEQALRPGRRS